MKAGKKVAFLAQGKKKRKKSGKKSDVSEEERKKVSPICLVKKRIGGIFLCENKSVGAV